MRWVPGRALGFECGHASSSCLRLGRELLEHDESLDALLVRVRVRVRLWSMMRASTHSWLGLGLGLGSGLGVGVGLDAHLRHRVGRQGSLLLNYYRLLNY